MTLIAIIAISTAFLLSINVGGNNSATEMGPAFGAGVRSKKEAVLLIAVFSMIGAVVAGERVVNTIGSGLMPGHLLQENIVSVIVILLSATLVIAGANVLRIPIATSHAMVGAVVGMGLHYGTVYWSNLSIIIVWWVITPLLSLTISYVVGRYIYARLNRAINNLPGQGVVRVLYRGFITLSGCYMAFSAGSNSLAKAVGPIVGAAIVTPNQAAVIGGLGMAFGALIVGHRLLHTVGKGITEIDALKATLIELISGTILMISSHAGIPVSLAEIITCSVIGFGAANDGVRSMYENRHVRRMYTLWPACPLITGLTSFALARLAAAAL